MVARRKKTCVPKSLQPTQEEIKERAAAIREEWDEWRWNREYQRAGVYLDNPVTVFLEDGE